jgi:hypothetical protein
MRDGVFYSQAPRFDTLLLTALPPGGFAFEVKNEEPLTVNAAVPLSSWQTKGAEIIRKDDRCLVLKPTAGRIVLLPSKPPVTIDQQ